VIRVCTCDRAEKDSVVGVIVSWCKAPIELVKDSKRLRFVEYLAGEFGLLIG
jgi:hypothetical protein